MTDDILELMRAVERERKLALEAVRGKVREPLGALGLSFGKGELLYDRATGLTVKVESGIRGRYSKD